jgi:REP element-mobilizing transposase RayT
MEQNEHHRRSIRLKGYDYSSRGAYFVTLVTHQRREIFGQIVDGDIRMSSLGQIVKNEWMRSNNVRREIRLNEDEFVVMPNHIHGIVWIVDPVGADNVVDNVGGAGRGVCHTPQRTPVPKRMPKSLSSFIAGFKAAVTSRAGKEFNIHSIWQRNYYEHIIRNDRELMNIWQYIDNNPVRWQEDRDHTPGPTTTKKGED